MTITQSTQADHLELLPQRKPHLKLIHAAIFLLATAAGAALIYSLQPPKPPPGSLLYELHLFTSNNRVEDFTPHFQMLQYNAAQGVRNLSGGDLVGNINFSSEPRMVTRFSLAIPTHDPPYPTLTGLQFEIRGDPIRDRTRLNLKIETDYTEAAHQFDLGEGEYRVVEVLTGEKDRRKWCYAIIFVEPTKLTTGLAVPFPAPAPAASGGS